MYQVEREFDLIEKKYNKLIEQKTVFAKRALARIHYILQEGSSDEDHIVKLINLLDHHANSPQVLEQMRDRIRVGTQFKNITDRSFYNRKNAEDAGFHPIAMEKHNEEKKHWQEPGCLTVQPVMEPFSVTRQWRLSAVEMWHWKMPCIWQPDVKKCI